jgi:16S rRNA (guanine966-N2)-methyltransferase
MRVISGQYKGRILKTVKDLSVRPATDRVKQTLFDMLATRLEFDGASVLDLFAGSGSLGIEALSRGAASAVFVETSSEAAGYIERNLELLDCVEKCEVLEMDALDYMLRANVPCDLVFADPPYRFEETARIPELVFQSHLVKPGGYLLIEHSLEVRFGESELYQIGPVKKFGRTLVTFFRPATLNGGHSKT